MTNPVAPQDTAAHPAQVSFPRPQGRELPARINQQDQVMTGEAVALDIRPANPVQILIGGAIDVFVELSIAIATFLTLFRYGSLPLEEAESIYSIIGLVTGFIIAPTAVETLSGGRSLGKWILSVQIVRDDGGRVRFRHAFIRSLVGIFEIVLTLGSGALIATLVNSRHKRLGDHVAGTYPISLELSELLPPPLRMPPELASWASRTDVSRIPASLVWQIRQFLNTNANFVPEKRASLAAELASRASAHVGTPPPEGTHPERFLAAVLVIRRDIEYRNQQRIESDLEAQLPSQPPYGLDG